MSRRRAIIASVLVGAAALLYGVSPLDLAPEILLGPAGLLDDAGVLIAAAVGIWKLLSGSRPAPAPAPPPEEQPRWEQKLPE